MKKDFCLCVNGVLIKAGTILLLKRNVKPFKGYWHTVGGQVEEGETYKQALKREYKEETNLDINVGPIIDGLIEETFDRIKIIIVCKIKESNGDIKLNSENQEFDWFSNESLPTKVVYNYLPYFDDVTSP